MKKLLPFAVVLCTLLAFTCNKSNNDSYDGLTGTWELVELQGGMVPTQNLPAGTERLVITSTTYEIHTKNAPTQSGSYTIVDDASVRDEVCLGVDEGQYTQRVILSGDESGRKIFFEINGTELKTLSGCFAYDAGVYKRYVRTSIGNVR